MERLLQNIPGVIPYFDDVIISAESKGQLSERLKAVLTRFREAGLKLKEDKCQIGVTQVEFLGFLIDAKGIRPTTSKLKAIKLAPTPKDKAELQAFLGLLNFYNVFLPQKATVAEPLHRLLDKNAVWKWGPKETTAFKQIKTLLTSDCVLVQYSEALPLVLTCDASPYGIGAVLSHKFPNGKEAPIAYFSKTLSKPQRNYSQLDKEALAAVAGVKRFHEYLYGRHFTLVTDHKPLLGIIAGNKPTPNILSPRMLRWTVFLAAYDYTLLHKPGKEIANADALSRCPLPDTVDDPAPTTSALQIEADLPGSLSATEIARFTARDETMARVLNFVWRGWPRSTGEGKYKPFEDRQTELSALKGCLLWGDRVVIPEPLRRRVLGLLHEGHPGIVRMKALARSYVWWPGLDKDIERWVASCQPCQETRPAPPSTKPTTWETPSGPWQRIHIDFAGPCQGQTFLIVVDAYSKWLEVVLMKGTTAEATIKALQKIFATHGLPDTIVSDNGPQFTAQEFAVFTAEQGIRHAFSAPAHPATNGQAEIMVKLTKGLLQRLGPGDWQDRINQLLLAQHITPHSTTNRSPAELLMGRKLRTKLDRVHPHYSPETPSDSTGKIRTFNIGDRVYAHNYTSGPLWIPGKITRITGPRSYQIETEDGRSWSRHIDQLRGRTAQQTTREPTETTPQLPREEKSNPTIIQTRGRRIPSSEETLSEIEPEYLSDESALQRSTSEASGSTVPRAPGAAFQQLLPAGTGAAADPSDRAAAPGTTELRRSSRTHRSPAYLQDYVR